ncbi:VOC family protein [Mesorhizobium loti]|uniref:VOC family protein n=1 Tax=Rhizobium loti TaxID=381 RepID=UPI000425DEA8|nr:glyoxalase/bleomycin resistance/dioxygenase family protein [Mesorhizobium loti]
MTTEGIQAVYLTTHNWGKAAKFFQALGYTLEFDTGHNSGQLRNGVNPYIFIAEVPQTEEPATRLVFRVPNESAVPTDPIVEVVTPFSDTHWGSREMTMRDPDGRLWNLETPPKG